MGEFANINTQTAYLGFKEKGYEVRFFEHPGLPFADIQRDTPVVGGIPIVVAALSHLGVNVPELPSVPSALERFAGRAIWTSTMQEARDFVSGGRPIFLKPVAADRKRFAGTVFREFRDLIPTAHVPPETRVICSDVVEFVSEYRAFVLDGEIIGLRHYKGDFRVFPDCSVIDAVVAAYRACPRAYGADFGITSQGKTLLVETNEAYSLGCYGLPPLRYSTFLERRWSELTGAQL